MARQILGMVTIPAVGGTVSVSSEGALAIHFDEGPADLQRRAVYLDEVSALKIAEALTTLVVDMMKAKRETDPPPAKHDCEDGGDVCPNCGAETSPGDCHDCGHAWGNR